MMLIEVLTPRPQRTPEALGWPPGFFEETAGSLPDFPLAADMSYAADRQAWEVQDSKTML